MEGGGGGKNCQNIDYVICEPLTENPDLPQRGFTVLVKKSL